VKRRIGDVAEALCHHGPVWDRLGLWRPLHAIMGWAWSD